MTDYRSAPPDSLDLTGTVPMARRDSGLSLVPATDVDRVFAALPTPYLVLSASLGVIAANAAFAGHAGSDPIDLVGRELTEVFDRLDSTDHDRVVAAIDLARSGGGTHSVGVSQPFGHGHDVDLLWLLVVSAVPSAVGRPDLILVRAENLGRTERGGDADTESSWQRRTVAAEADLATLTRSLASALRDKHLAATQLARLNEVTLRVNAAETTEELERIVVGHGLPVLGADGGAIAEVDGHGGVRLAIDPGLGDQIVTRYSTLPLDSPLPAVYTARTGRRVLLPTQTSGLAFTAEMADVYRASGRRAWAFLPLRVREEMMGSLAVSWVDEQEFTPEVLVLLDAFAAQCAQSLQQIRRAQARRHNTRELERLAEALQQALLTPPPEPDELHIAVRYRPAAHQAQVGGDWYDAFVQPDGDTMLTIGDVVGHDSTAAAAMGQLRGLLRSLAYCTDDALLPDTPAAALSRTEYAARGLAVDTLASVLLARICGPAEDHPGRRVVRWSNAGHLPPLIVHPDGSSELWESIPDLLLGVDPRTGRQDHTGELPDGSTLVLFTDGLVERRGSGLDDGLRSLQAAVADLGSTDLETMCDLLLSRMTADGGEDDIALLAVRHRDAG